MDNTNLNEKIELLGSELRSLKESLSAPDKANTFGGVLRRANRFISTYQPLLTVMIAIVTLILLQMNFGFGTLASYVSALKGKAANKKVADFYLQLGDRLIYDVRYEDAATAYKSCLNLEPNNSRAIYGLAKATIFDPPAGNKYSDPELVAIKLNFLRSQFGNDPEANSDLEFLRCQNYESRDDSLAEESCRKATELNPGSYSAFIYLGYLCQKRADFDCAKASLDKAVALNPSSRLAMGNLGSFELSQLHTEGAIQYLEAADAIAPDMLTILDLGEAYRYSKDIEKAIQMHSYGVEWIEEKDIEDQSVAGGTGWLIPCPTGNKIWNQ